MLCVPAASCTTFAHAISTHRVGVIGPANEGTTQAARMTAAECCLVNGQRGAYRKPENPTAVTKGSKWAKQYLEAISQCHCRPSHCFLCSSLCRHQALCGGTATIPFPPSLFAHAVFTLGGHQLGLVLHSEQSHRFGHSLLACVQCIQQHM